VRSLDIDDTKSASRGNDIYDDDSFSVAYSFALVTEGTLLGEYEDGRSDVVDVSSLSAPSTWNDSQTISSRDIENNMGRSTPKNNEHEKYHQDAVSEPSVFQSFSRPSSGQFAQYSSLPMPIDISTMPEPKSKSKGGTALNEERKKCANETSERVISKTASSLRPLRTKNGKIIDKDLALSLGFSEEEYVEMVTCSGVKEKCDQGIDSSEDRIELKRTSSLKNFTNQIISLKRSISDSKIKL